jgi:hypothetical protein
MHAVALAGLFSGGATRAFSTLPGSSGTEPDRPDGGRNLLVAVL